MKFHAPHANNSSVTAIKLEAKYGIQADKNYVAVHVKINVKKSYFSRFYYDTVFLSDVLIHNIESCKSEVHISSMLLLEILRAEK